jgi:hypothetical protein
MSLPTPTGDLRPGELPRRPLASLVAGAEQVLRMAVVAERLLVHDLPHEVADVAVGEPEARDEDVAEREARARDARGVVQRDVDAARAEVMAAGASQGTRDWSGSRRYWLPSRIPGWAVARLRMTRPVRRSITQVRCRGCVATAYA